MISAGQQHMYGNNRTQQPGMQYPSMAYTPQYPQWNYPVSGGPNISFDAELGKEGAESALLGSQIMQGVGMAVSAGFQIGNQILAGKAMDHQFGLMKKQFELQGDIVDAQKEVATKQLGVQETAIFVQQKMHAAQLRHEERLARYQNNAQARLKVIEESGQTERMKIATATDAFSRRGWDMGNPLYS